ncbi:family 43 glycosylhydrolase [Sphingomonas piscis]|uniref:Family 43 glycosylhydrolase n=1 Tax=Sphingomonas piscis TaxID=2714943 RepID=A0A6G7YQB1_9SPHN|nr:glycoside hydrolase family 43 protein [Sphingomonas piscis]QIK78924.1 family 43 glycosylhydrolase [Sphingomonas piscis]
MTSKSARSFRRIALAILGAMMPCAAGAQAWPQPVYREDFPDPFIIETRGRYLAYSTNTAVNVPMLQSSDLRHWSPLLEPSTSGKLRDALPQLGPWARAGFTWAPEVIRIGRRWRLYYTARSRTSDRQCVGVASADRPDGPFRDRSPTPLVCQDDLGGSIDASPFRDRSGALYLLYKNDGNSIGAATSIWSQRLTPDGLRLRGRAAALLTNRVDWQGGVIEAPTMIRRGGAYQLFFSGGAFGWPADAATSPYAIGYATCRGPMGPCTPLDEPLLASSVSSGASACLSGPGHQALFESRGRTFIAFHGWAVTDDCRRGAAKRLLYIARLRWVDGAPVIGPVPSTARR